MIDMTKPTRAPKPPAKKKAAKKTASWIAAATAADGADTRGRALRKDEERRLPAGSTFRFETPGPGQVLMAAVLPTKTRGVQFSIPPSLERSMRDATGGVRWTTALIALADYALDLLEAAPAKVTIEPEEDPEGDVACYFTLELAKRLTLHLTGPLPGWNRETRRRIGVPADVRARIEAVRKEGSFTGVLLALAQYALIDLKKRRKCLIVQPA